MKAQHDRGSWDVVAALGPDPDLPGPTPVLGTLGWAMDGRYAASGVMAGWRPGCPCSLGCHPGPGPFPRSGDPGWAPCALLPAAPSALGGAHQALRLLLAPPLGTAVGGVGGGGHLSTWPGPTLFQRQLPPGASVSCSSRSLARGAGPSHSPVASLHLCWVGQHPRAQAGWALGPLQGLSVPQTTQNSTGGDRGRGTC